MKRLFLITRAQDARLNNVVVHLLGTFNHVEGTCIT